MKIKYIDEHGKILTFTEDYVPKIGEFITIDNITYEVSNKKTAIVALHTEVEVRLIEKIFE